MKSLTHFSVMGILVIASFFFGCQQKVVATSSEEDRLIAAAYGELGSPVRIEYSPEKNFALCIQENAEGNGEKVFVVLRVDDLVVVHPKNKIRGRVYWENERMLKVITLPLKAETPDSDHEASMYFITLENQ